jgi:hypothetical protein
LLLEKEVLSFDDVKGVLGPRQWEFNPLHEEYMKMRHPDEIKKEAEQKQ